jgi:hypothetical protein
MDAAAAARARRRAELAEAVAQRQAYEQLCGTLEAQRVSLEVDIEELREQLPQSGAARVAEQSPPRPPPQPQPQPQLQLEPGLTAATAENAKLRKRVAQLEQRYVENLDSLKRAGAEKQQLEQKLTDHEKLNRQLVDEASSAAAQHIFDREHDQLAISNLERAVADARAELAQQQATHKESLRELAAKVATEQGEERESLALRLARADCEQSRLQAANAKLTDDLGECRLWLSTQTTELAASEEAYAAEASRADGLQAQAEAAQLEASEYADLAHDTAAVLQDAEAEAAHECAGLHELCQYLNEQVERLTTNAEENAAAYIDQMVAGRDQRSAVGKPATQHALPGEQLEYGKNAAEIAADRMALITAEEIEQLEYGKNAAEIAADRMALITAEEIENHPGAAAADAQQQQQ